MYLSTAEEMKATEVNGIYLYLHSLMTLKCNMNAFSKITTV